MKNGVNIGYYYRECGGVGYYTNPAFDERGVLNCFTSRVGGVSEKPFDTLNMSFSRPTSRAEDVLRNYTILCGALGISVEQLVLVNYCHGDGVELVGRKERGNGVLYPNRLPECDAIMTNDPGTALLTIHADCTSFIVFDPVKRAIAAAHAGWKGTILKIGAKTIARMAETFGSDPADCIVGIGPNIGFDKFEVDLPVVEQFREQFAGHEGIIRSKPNGKYLIDLSACAVIQFKEAGVREENITVSGCCTYSDPDRFFSYRRDGRSSGSMAEILMLRD